MFQLLSGLSTEVFADNELDLPYELAHFHQIANSVVMAGEHKGFIGMARLKLVKPYRLTFTSINC